MKLLVRGILALTSIASVLVLFLSAWPGLLDEVVFMVILLSVVWFPIMVLGAALIGFISYLRRRRGHPVGIPVREAIACPIVAAVTIILLVANVPMRLGFLLSRSAFQAAAPSAPSSQHGGVHLDRRLGIYKVDEYATDSRGGVFFRIHAGPDGIGPDTMSYGFVWKPNHIGTPFGAAHYVVRHLAGAWYYFEVSDDFY
jgi:hypothetical protein